MGEGADKAQESLSQSLWEAAGPSRADATAYSLPATEVDQVLTFRKGTKGRAMQPEVGRRSFHGKASGSHFCLC